MTGAPLAGDFTVEQGRSQIGLDGVGCRYVFSRNGQ
jgi:hypothetical protein